MSPLKPSRKTPGPPPHGAPPGFDGVVKATGWDFKDGRLGIKAETAAGSRCEILFQAPAPAIWRMTFLPPGSEIPAPTGILADAPADTGPSPALRLKDIGSSLRVSGAALTLVIDKDPWSLRFLGPDGEDVLADNPADIDGLGRLFVPPLGFVQPDVPSRGFLVTVSFRLGAIESLYGLGEKFTRLDKVGRRIVSWTQDAFGSTSERSHKNVPFLWSTKGWGLLLDTGARIVWDLGSASTQSWTAAVEAPALDAYIIYGPAPREILARYTGLTGRAPIPPKWSFGLWLSSGGTYRDEAAVEKLVAGAEERRLPVDVIHVDPWWMRWRKYCDFRWDRRAFPDPDAFLARLHRRGLKLILRLPLGPPRLSRSRRVPRPPPSARPEALSLGASLRLRRKRSFRRRGGQRIFRAPVRRRRLHHRLRAVPRPPARWRRPHREAGGFLERVRRDRRSHQPGGPGVVQGAPSVPVPSRRRRFQDGLRRGRSGRRGFPRRADRRRYP